MPSSCATCGNPLPTVPADPAHPERCPACAARAVGAPGPTSNLPPPPPGGFSAVPAMTSRDLVVRTRLLDAVLTGLAFAALGGAAWWGIVFATGRDLPYLAVLVGIFAGQGVLVGARRGGPAQGAIAAVFTIIGLAVAQYFVSRTVGINANSNLYLPLWENFGDAKTLVTDTLSDDKLTALYWLAGVAVAVFSAIVPSRTSPLG